MSGQNRKIQALFELKMASSEWPKKGRLLDIFLLWGLRMCSTNVVAEASLDILLFSNRTGFPWRLGRCSLIVFVFKRRKTKKRVHFFFTASILNKYNHQKNTYEHFLIHRDLITSLNLVRPRHVGWERGWNGRKGEVEEFEQVEKEEQVERGKGGNKRNWRQLYISLQIVFPALCRKKS